MEDQALQHVMNVQTQMLQHITNLQQEQTRNELNQPGKMISETASNMQGTTASFGTPIPEHIASPTAPPPIDSTVAPGSMSVKDPTAYATYAAPYAGSGGRLKQAGQAATGFASSFLGGSIAQMREFDATRHSKEETSAFISQQARGVQEQAVGVMGGAVSGAVSAGSLFLPGLIPALAVGGAAAIGVGGVTKAITDETKVALDYQDLLQKESYRFLNAFESTNEMGGIGMGLNDRQEVSKYLRDLAPDKYLEDGEMMEILQGASENNLLKTVEDVKSFKKKFSEVVDAVKEITITMNQSIEEATQFMGEMESRGINTKDMPFIAAQTKVMSSMLGLSAEEGAGIVLQTTDSITNGTALNNKNVIASSTENMFYAQQIQDFSKDTKPELYDYIKNNGGAAGAGAMFEQKARGLIDSQRGTEMLMGLYASGFEFNEETGAFEVNQDKMRDLLDGGYTVDQMQSMSRSALSGMDANQLRRLQGTAGTLFNNAASNEELGGVLGNIADSYMQRAAQSGNPIDLETALVEAGISSNYEEASFDQKMIQASGNEDLNKLFTARSFKEMQDSNAISNSPGVFKKMKFWWERNVTNNIGDAGQWTSDKIGQSMNEYQKFITGIDDRSTVGAESLEEFNRDGLENYLENLETMNQSTERIQDEYGPLDLSIWGKKNKGTVDAEAVRKQFEFTEPESFDKGTYQSYMSKAQKNRLTAADLASVNTEDMSFAEFNRYSLVENEAKGEYEGFWGKVNYAEDRTFTAISNGGEWVYDKTIGGLIKAWKGDTSALDDANASGDFESLEKQQEKLVKEKKDLNSEIMALFTTDEIKDFDKEKLKALEKSIRSGDVGEVENITKNDQAAEIARRYQTLSGVEEDFSKGMGSHKELSQYTQAIATTGTQLGDLLNASGGFSESEIDAIVGDLREQGKDTTKSLKKNDLSTEQMIKNSDEMLAEVDSVFNTMTEYDLNNLAKFLVEKDSSLKMESFYEQGTSTVDTEALQSYVMNDVLRNQHIKPNAEKMGDSEGSANADDVKKAAGDHEEAMYTFLSSFQNETQMMQDVMDGRAVTKPKMTSLGSG